MKKSVFLLILVFIINTIGLNAEIFVGDLEKIKVVEFEGFGKAGKSNIKALKQSDSYDAAKKNAQAEIGNYIKGIKTNENISLEELAQSSLILQKIFADTIKESKITFKVWDKEDNAQVKIRVDMIILKEKLNKLGVK